MAVPFLIVGQGLAGTALAFELLELGAKVQVCDQAHKNAASVVAAGLLNPVTGQRLRLTWQAREHLAAAERFYRKREEQFGLKILEHREVLRIFASEAEWQRWQKRRADPDYKGFLGAEWPPGTRHQGLKPLEFGGCDILGAAYVDTQRYLKSARSWLREQGLLREETLNHQDLNLSGGAVRWKNQTWAAVIFCEGMGVLRNPWFGRLPFQPAKGQLVELEIQTAPPQKVVNRGKWILPLDNGRVRLGSTFEWDILDCKPTPQGLRELLGHAVRVLEHGACPQVLRHDAGVRPCSHDQRPYVGRHPELGTLAIFNGFGAKGALTTPLCARRMARHLVAGEPLHPDEALARLPVRAT